jgi:hypothetical protein
VSAALPPALAALAKVVMLPSTMPATMDFFIWRNPLYAYITLLYTIDLS